MNSSQGRMQVLWGLKLIQVLGPFREKEYKITNTKLGMKVKMFRVPLKILNWPVQKSGSEAKTSLASR